MSSGYKWVISSSGHHMFIKFVVDLYNYGPGFLANFHFGIKQYWLLPFLKILMKLNPFSVNCMTTKNGDLGFCSCQSCSENEGDCDFHSHCQGDLKCGSNNCPDSYGFDSNTDCCYASVVGTEDFCTIGEPCDADEGDCDSDDECRYHSFCGSNNCPDSLGVSPEVDCCEPKGKTITISILKGSIY